MCGAPPPTALAQAAAGTAGIHDVGVDETVAPGDDFDAYANGAWLAATEIPAGRNRWGARDEIDAATRSQLAAVFADAEARRGSRPARQVADFHAAYLDDATIEARGLAPLKPSLDRIAGVRDKVGLARLLGSEMRADVDPLNWGVFASSHVFGLSVEHGIHGDGRNHAYLLQGGLGLPDSEAYRDATPAGHAVLERYRAYIARTLQRIGVAHAGERAAAVLTLETALAATHASSADSGNERNADNRWSRAEFPTSAPGLDWPAFFAAAGLSARAEFVAWQPDAIRGEAALVGSQPLAVWKDYLRFHLVDRYADVLPRDIADAALAVRASDLATAPTPRAQRAIDATGAALPDAVGRLYVERVFPAATKARLQTIAANVIDAFGRRIAALAWMAPETKTQAVAKLKTLYFGVGYPEAWADDSRLVIDGRDAFGNVRRVAAWNYERALARLDQPAEPTEWLLPAQAVGAVSIPQQNAYNFAAALLQAPKADPTASDAMLYGSIGAIFGHEISHFVDPLGADHDAAGASRHWWLPEDDTGFEAASQPLVDQYAGYRPLPDIVIDGRTALAENVADLGGLAAAFDAYRLALGARAIDRHLVHLQDRAFFIGYAHGWRVKMRDDALRARAASDHAPEALRIATVRNLDAWYDAFDVRPGQRLYLAPKARVRIW